MTLDINELSENGMGRLTPSEQSPDQLDGAVNKTGSRPLRTHQRQAKSYNLLSLFVVKLKLARVYGTPFRSSSKASV